MRLKRISNDREMTTLETNIADEYKRLSHEIMQAKVHGNNEQVETLLQQLIEFMVSVGDAR